MKLERLGILAVVFLVLAATLPAQDNDDHDDDQPEGLYFHEHNGVGHDLSMARIEFEGDEITNPELQLHGRWELKNFDSTDYEMLELIYKGAFNIWMEVTEDYMQVKLTVTTNGKDYSDPAHEYEIQDGEIHLENFELDAALKDGDLIFTMVAADEAYRYTFSRELPPGTI